MSTICSGYSWADGGPMIRANVFAHLLDLAAVVTSHRSDLFHDALWIDRNVNGPTTFFYSVRDTGTWIASTWETLPTIAGTVHRVALACDDRERWTVTSEVAR